MFRQPTVTIVGDQTKLTRTQNTNDTGAYYFVNLPIGSYTLTFTHAGFQTLNIPSIQVQANRTATVNAHAEDWRGRHDRHRRRDAPDERRGHHQRLRSGKAADSKPIPLPTGSFTGVAILSPGVNAELPGGTGANAGLGNQPIWANGQRDTSNSFLLNGVDASNLFNGKSTSSVASARIVNNTGIGGAQHVTHYRRADSEQRFALSGDRPGAAHPAPETIQEVRVNTSMYDAQQGSTSGAHIDMSTASGTNDIHGSAYVHRGTDWLNAAPLFLQRRPQHSRPTRKFRNCTATPRAELSAVRSSRTSCSAFSATSTCTIPTRRSALSRWPCPSD